MREIEVKAKLQNKEKLLALADKLGIQFGDEITQDDTTYETTLPKDNPDWNIFRIRKQNGKQILTMKYRASTSSRDHFEYESVIENEDEIVNILERLGYNYGVQIHKKRRTAKYQGLEICLDEITELGDFVEVEKLAKDDADVEVVQAELWALLKQLGVAESDRIHKGYDMIMRDKLTADTAKS